MRNRNILLAAKFIACANGDRNRKLLLSVGKVPQNPYLKWHDTNM
jgi:hypothetical protein